MNLTYEVNEKGYTILNDGKPWIVQDSYIPYPGATLEESAQNHINEIMKENENPTVAPPSAEQAELEALKIKVDLQEQTLSETNATLLEFMESSILA